MTWAAAVAGAEASNSFGFSHSADFYSQAAFVQRFGGVYSSYFRMTPKIIDMPSGLSGSVDVARDALGKIPLGPTDVNVITAFERDLTERTDCDVLRFSQVQQKSVASGVYLI